ncbi:MAG: hypothetical protein IJ622_03110 [Bacteroidales bacterium]|nr:hypothetical protein [Bacteroidales bacterium]
MKRLLVIGILATLTFAFASCGDRISKEFKAMQTEVQDIEKQIAGTDDCDELQMLHIAVLGLRSDVDNLKIEAAIPETETDQLETMIDELEATCNGKRASLDCDQVVSDDDLDTSGDFGDDDAL